MTESRPSDVYYDLGRYWSPDSEDLDVLVAYDRADWQRIGRAITDQQAIVLEPLGNQPHVMACRDVHAVEGVPYLMAIDETHGVDPVIRVTFRSGVIIRAKAPA